MNPVLPWQHRDWAQLNGLSGSLPHAMLILGMEGIGKVVFARTFAQAVLCQATNANGFPCGECLSCGWFAQNNHPDFRQVRPEILEDEPMGGEDQESETGKSAKAVKAPSREIKIDQIRALSGFIHVTTHRQGKRVVLLYPAEALNNAASNALLKTLEEPPPDTLFLLVAHRPDRLLPTIRSRCRSFHLAPPSRDEALAWLSTQGIENAEFLLAQEGGAPLAAVSQSSQPELQQALTALLDDLCRPGTDRLLRAAERVQKLPLSRLVVWIQRWLYDVFSVKLSGTIRFYPGYRKELTQLAERADTPKLMVTIRNMNERRAVAEHPLSVRLFVEDMLLDYAALFTRNVNG